MKTYMATASSIERKWYVVDAADYTLGRLASQVAAVLRGKNKPHIHHLWIVVTTLSLSTLRRFSLQVRS